MEINREKAITRTSVIGIIANIFLVIFKAAVGLLSGSIAIVLDAVNNLTDALSSVITIAGIKLARRKPDDKHPFGHGRIEYFSTILISFIILFAGFTSIIESIKKIITPEVANYSVVTIIIVVASVIVKFLLGRYVKAQGKKYNSDALVASGADASFDAIISVSTLVGAAVTLIFHISIDGIIGAIISIFIIKAGFEMLIEAVGNVMGKRANSEVTMAIKQKVREIPGVIGAYDLVLHDYGPETAMGSIHVEVPAEINAAEIHDLTDKIQRMVFDEFQVVLTVGIYAVSIEDEEKKNMRQSICEVCTALEGAINTHGVYINVEEKRMSFDITIDFSVRDKEAFIKAAKEAVNNLYPGYEISINLDRNYSE